MTNNSLRLLEGLVLTLRSVKHIARIHGLPNNAPVLYDCCMEALETLTYILDNEVLEPMDPDWNDEGPTT